MKNPTRQTIAEPIAIPLGEGIVGTVAATRRGEVVHDTRQDARYIADQFDGASELAVPMVCAGTLLGVIDSEADAVGAFADPDLQIFEAFANVAAGRVASLRGERQHRERRRPASDNGPRHWASWRAACARLQQPAHGHRDAHRPGRGSTAPRAACIARRRAARRRAVG